MLAIFAFVGWIVYWAISHSAKKNKVYQACSSEHGYQCDKAQGNDYYRDYSKQKTSNDLTLKLFQNPYMQGVNLTFPFLERRQAVFVDFVIFGTTVSDRRTAMMSFLCEHGHFVEEVKNGTETLLKIDNIFYRIVPKTVSCQGIPVQGALLSPVYR